MNNSNLSLTSYSNELEKSEQNLNTTRKGATTKEQKEDACDYLNKHKINDVLNILTSSLVFKRPFNCRRHIVDYLTKLKKSRDTFKIQQQTSAFLLTSPEGPEDHLLFETSNLSALFDMSDILKNGTINEEIACKLAEIVGIDKESSNEMFRGIAVVEKSFFMSKIEEFLRRDTAHYDR